MEEKKERNYLKVIKEVVLDIDPEGVMRDARDAGIEVVEIKNFRKQTHNYWRIET